jgi:hypothetical protein
MKDVSATCEPEVMDAEDPLFISIHRAPPANRRACSTRPAVTWSMLRRQSSISSIITMKMSSGALPISAGLPAHIYVYGRLVQEPRRSCSRASELSEPDVSGRSVRSTGYTLLYCTHSYPLDHERW